MKIGTKVIAGSFVAAVAAALPATTASAESYAGPNGYISGSCAGAQVDAGRVYNAGQAHPTAVWRLYYSAAGNGTNCLMLWDNKAGAHDMFAAVRPADNFHDGAKDWGTFNTYAGAVNVKNVSGRCVGVTLQLNDGGRTWTRDVSSFHCG